jgi:hypothetical protein
MTKNGLGIKMTEKCLKKRLKMTKNGLGIKMTLKCLEK